LLSLVLWEAALLTERSIELTIDFALGIVWVCAWYGEEVDVVCETGFGMLLDWSVVAEGFWAVWLTGITNGDIYF